MVNGRDISKSNSDGNSGNNLTHRVPVQERWKEFSDEKKWIMNNQPTKQFNSTGCCRYVPIGLAILGILVFLTIAGFAIYLILND